MKKSLATILALLLLLTMLPAASLGASAEAALADAPFEGWGEGLPKIQAPEGFDWKQFSGTTLNFISENTTPSTAIAANIEQFEKVTGIKVVIEQADLNAVVEKVGLDVNARTAKYPVIYLDPQQIMAKTKDNLGDLNVFNSDPALPHIPGGLEDFYESQVQCCSYMGDTDKLLAIPTTTRPWCWPTVRTSSPTRRTKRRSWTNSATTGRPAPT
jgi:multiple sugar transport system substrate-binding protein